MGQLSARLNRHNLIDTKGEMRVKEEASTQIEILLNFSGMKPEAHKS